MKTEQKTLNSAVKVTFSCLMVDENQKVQPLLTLSIF